MAGLFDEPTPFPGQDPWVVPFEHSLLLVQSVGNNRKITIKRFSDVRHIDDYDEQVVWAPRPAPLGHSDHARQLWAPELHHIDGRWFIYYAASNGSSKNHRMYVLAADHPFGPYEELGKVFDPAHDIWSIDMTVLRHNNRLYAVWSSWEEPNDGSFQNLYIAPMSDPWTISGDRQLISRPEHGWEMSAGAINEGPEVLRNRQAGKLFIVFSADASWTNAYKMGLLEWTGGDVMDPAAWTKLDRPIFTGGGHGSFVSDAEGDYVIYHRKRSSDPGWADREIRWEPYTWDDDGYPVIGQPGTAHEAAQRHAQRRPAAVGFPSPSEAVASVPPGAHRVAHHPG